METGGSAEAFSTMGTLGIEEEFFIVDDTGRPVSGTDTLVYDTDPPAILEDRLDHELFKFVIETQTPTIDRFEDARASLYDVRDALVEHATTHGYQIAGAGLHPSANWRELEHAEKPRYTSQLDRIQYPQHRNTTAGLHIHIGVDDADKAVWIANEIRWYLPIVLALSANSPFWCGFDTGLASARAKIFEALPNTGMPTAFAGIDEYLEFEHALLETNSIRDRGELWYDVRPHTEHGTVEIRSPDSQADPDRVMAFVEYIHALVYELSDEYEAGVRSTKIRRELLDENKWRAIRYGQNASFISKDGSEEIELATIVHRECKRLGISGIQAIHDDESGAEMQRRLLREDGRKALQRELVLSPVNE